MLSMTSTGITHRACTASNLFQFMVSN